MYNLNKTFLDKESVRTGFIRDNLEKVYRLIDILRFIDDNSFLRDLLVLKGGTAINLTVFDLPRLSVDIDLDFNKECSKEEMLLYREKIRNIIRKYLISNEYSIDDNKNKETHSLESWVCKYKNVVGNIDNIKIEINYSMRNHIFKPIRSKINLDLKNSEVKVLTLQAEELFGSKIKALLERTAARDLYDVNNMICSNVLNKRNLEMLKKSVIFYKTVGSTGNVNEEFNFERIDELDFDSIRRTLLPVLVKSSYIDLQKMKNNVKSFLKDLLVLNENEKKYIKTFVAGEFYPELLFQDSEIVNRINKHPMALWKTSM